MVRSCQDHVEYIGADHIRCRVHGKRELSLCGGCNEFRLTPQPPYVPTVVPEMPQPLYAGRPQCKHLGTMLRIAPCCGQMYACGFHKGKKCAPVGVAQDPFLSCETCDDFAYPDTWLSDYDRFKNRCIAVTSLSSNPARQARQVKCLRSWREFGLQVVAINTHDEHAAFRHEITELIIPFVNPSLAIKYKKPVQLVTDMLAVGATYGIPFVMLNADIEIKGDHSEFSASIDIPHKVTIGVRYNHAEGTQHRFAQREIAGLDAFLLTPEMVATITPMQLGFGKPVWDYWLPHHLRLNGYQINWLTDPLCYHEEHLVQWSKDEWELGAGWFRKLYDVDVQYEVMTFRDSLEVLI